MLYIAIAVGFIPSFAWLLFYLREDISHPEPKKMIALAFLLGGLATFMALYIETWTSSWLLAQYEVTNYSPTSLLIFAFIEETLKFLVIFWFIRRSIHFDEPVDAMIYMITAALGFAAVENIAAAVNQWNDYLVIESVFQTITLRFIGATLLHTLSSGLIGYYWARGRQYRERFIFILGGILIATFAHAFFNLSILSYKSIIIPTMFLLIIGLFVLNDFEKLKRPS